MRQTPLCKTDRNDYNYYDKSKIYVLLETYGKHVQSHHVTTHAMICSFRDDLFFQVLKK